MVADSFTDSQLFYGSPISTDFAKANLFCKLKQWKIDARRKQWIYHCEEEKSRRLQSLLDKLTQGKAWRIDYEHGSEDNYDDDDERTSSASSPTSVLKSKGSVSDDCFCCSNQMREEEGDLFDDALDDSLDDLDDGFSDALNSFENESPLHERTDLKQQDAPIPNTSTSHRNKSSRNQLFHKDNKCKPEETSPAKKATIHKNCKTNKSSDSQQKQGDEQCPICLEPMDATDLSFQSCPCGYRLCLFCHKTISENDGRCPACRKKYEQTSNNSGEVSFQQRGLGTIRLSPSFRGLDRA